MHNVVLFLLFFDAVTCNSYCRVVLRGCNLSHNKAWVTACSPVYLLLQLKFGQEHRTISIQVRLKLINLVYRNGYTGNRSDFTAAILDRDMKLWTKIINDDKNSLQNLLPNKSSRNLKQRGHDFELRLVKTG